MIPAGAFAPMGVSDTHTEVAPNPLLHSGAKSHIPGYLKNLMSENINNNPSACSAVGLTCTGCTESAARDLASVCKGLTGQMLSQLFVQLYPGPSCSRMCAHFSEAYREAARPPRKPVVSEAGLLAAVAVA